VRWYQHLQKTSLALYIKTIEADYGQGPPSYMQGSI